MKDILTFWDWKNNQKTIDIDLLKQTIRDFYTEDFIVNYNKWKDNISELNSNIKQYLIDINYPIEYWEDMSFDWFCKNILDLFDDWINQVKTIDNNDIGIIMEQLIGEYINVRLDDYDKRHYTIANLLETIKSPLLIKTTEDNNGE